MLIFFAWNLLNIDFSLREICTFFFSSWTWFGSWRPLRADFLSELVASWFMYVKLVVCWFFPFVKLVNWFCSARETDFVYGTAIFTHFSSWSLLRSHFCSWNLLYIGFFITSNLYNGFSSWTWFGSWNLSRVYFLLELVACKFFFRETSCISIFFFFYMKLTH